MNPLTNVKNLQKMNERELKLGLAGNDSKSWHQKYKDSAWIFVGGLSYDLSEGDVIAVFSQYGEIVNLNLVRDRQTGKSRGFCFVCYEDQRSTNLAVDNLNGSKVANRIMRVDHVEEYKVPKERGDEDEIVKKLHMEGCAPSTSSTTTSVTPAPVVKSENEDNNFETLIKQEKTNEEEPDIRDKKAHSKKSRDGVKRGDNDQKLLSEKNSSKHYKKSRGDRKDNGYLPPPEPDLARRDKKFREEKTSDEFETGKNKKRKYEVDFYSREKHYCSGDKNYADSKYRPNVREETYIPARYKS